MNISDLHNKIGWICFTYSDGSKRVVRTTLNSDMLASVIKDKADNDLYDLDKLKWIRIPSNPEVTMTISEDRPELREVDEFANRFI